MDTTGNLIWFSKQDFRTLKRFFEYLEPFLRVLKSCLENQMRFLFKGQALDQRTKKGLNLEPFFSESVGLYRKKEKRRRKKGEKDHQINKQKQERRHKNKHQSKSITTSHFRTYLITVKSCVKRLLYQPIMACAIVKNLSTSCAKFELFLTLAINKQLGLYYNEL